VWNFFNRKEAIPDLFHTDLHSHLLPNLDDGVESFEQSAQIIFTFMELGLTKAITTPHIKSDSYRNSPETILPRLQELRQYLAHHRITFDIHAAAEYYFDEITMDLVSKNAPLLTFGDRYLLFETNTFSEPMMLNDFIFQLKVKGYKPVLAHPERYQYLQNNLERVEDLIDRGTLMQVNSLSLSGHYSRAIQKTANQLVENQLVHFLGSDCHTPHHARLLKETFQSKNFHKALNLPLLNYSL
jgi:tyrosine-protein phosphatase YwqE